MELSAGGVRFCWDVPLRRGPTAAIVRAWCPNRRAGGRVGKGSGLTRGDVRRNARTAAMRARVPESYAVVGVDLGERKQALAVTGEDNRVLARRRPRTGGAGGGGPLAWAR